MVVVVVVVVVMAVIEEHSVSWAIVVDVVYAKCCLNYIKTFKLIYK